MKFQRMKQIMKQIVNQINQMTEEDIKMNQITEEDIKIITKEEYLNEKEKN